jgi:hypothetical protein
MKDLGKKIKIKIDSEELDFLLLKRFTYKKEDYVLVMDDNCECNDGCGDECSCGCNEKGLYIFKKDKNNEYSYIEDKKELDEVIKHIDKIFYED